MQCYFNDILAGVVILAYSNLLFIVVRKEEHSFRSLIRILFFVFIAGMFWEFIAPMFRRDSVSDLGDIMAYLIGGITYWAMIRKTIGEQINSADARPRR